MRTNKIFKRPFWHQFAAWNTDGGDGGEGGGAGGNDSGNDNAGNDDAGKQGDDDAGKKSSDTEAKKLLAKLEKEKKALESKLAGYQKKEQEEADKNKSAEQRAADAEAKTQKLERDNLIARMALKKGFDADLIDRVQGSTPEEIEADMDLLLGKLAKTEPKTAQGGGTESAAGKQTPKQPDDRPYLVKLGLVKDSKAV